MEDSQNREADERGSDERRVIQEGKFFAAIGYFSFLCVVPLALKRGNPFAEFHGRQALVLFIFELAASILKAVPLLGTVLFTAAWVVFGIASLTALVRVLSNDYWKMPVVYPIAAKMTL